MIRFNPPPMRGGPFSPLGISRESAERAHGGPLTNEEYVTILCEEAVRRGIA